jgi:hypothetical protein
LVVQPYSPGPNSGCDVWTPYTMLGQLRPSDEYFAVPLSVFRCLSEARLLPKLPGRACVSG